MSARTRWVGWLAAGLLAAMLGLSLAGGGGGQAGTDTQAQELIRRIDPEYEPWARPAWAPPTPGAERLLFLAQAAAGLAAAGYCLRLLGARAPGRSEVNRRAPD